MPHDLYPHIAHIPPMIDQISQSSPKATADWSDLLTHGTELTRRHRYKDAIAALHRALALRPDLAAIHRQLGLALQAGQLWRDAILPQQRALSISPDDPNILLELAASLLDGDDPVTTAKYLEKAAATHPSRADVQILRATALLDSGRPDDALVSFRRAQALAPDRYSFADWSQGRPADLSNGPVGDMVSYCRSHGIQTPAPPNSGAYVVCPLPNAYASGYHFPVIGADGSLFLDGVVFSAEAFRDRPIIHGQSRFFIGRRRYLGRIRPVRHIPGSHLLIGNHQNFGHWLFNCFGRLAYLNFLPELKHLPLVVSRDLASTSRELLAIAGYGEERLTIVEPSELNRFERLYVPTTLFALRQAPRRVVLNSACTQFLNRLAGRYCPRASTKRRRFYLLRPQGGHRVVANEGALLDVLARFRIEAIDPMRLSMRAQIEFARSAELLIGVIGAGMSLACFATPGTAVIQLTVPDIPLNSLPIICRQVRQPFVEIFCPRAEATKNPLYDNLIAPLDQVTAAIERMLVEERR